MNIVLKTLSDFLFLFFYTEDKGDSDEDDEGLEDLLDLSDDDNEADIDDLEEEDSGTICFCNELGLALFRVRYSLWLWNYKIFCICFQHNSAHIFQPS